MRPVKYRFARRLDKIEMSGIRRIFELAKGMKDAVDLSLGQPHFEVPAPVREAAIRAIHEGHNRYTVTQGIPPLQEKLRARLAARFGGDPGGLLITAGAAGGLFLAVTALVDEGDGVLIPDPYFVIYRHLVNAAGGVPQMVDTYPDFRLTVRALEAAATPQTRYLLLNTPVNPTGVAYRREEMAAFADFARRRGLVVISDEIYDEYVYDRPHEAMRPHYEHTLTVGGFSKTYAIPGWRLGWVCGPPEIVDRMTTMQQFSFVNANSVAQSAAVTMLDLDMRPWIEPYRAKRDLVYEGLRERFACVRPEGAFYIFPKAPGGSAAAFVKRAIERNLLIVPGGAASGRDTHFRVSFAAPDDVLRRGIDILNSLA